MYALYASRYGELLGQFGIAIQPENPVNGITDNPVIDSDNLLRDYFDDRMWVAAPTVDSFTPLGYSGNWWRPLDPSRVFVGMIGPSLVGQGKYYNVSTRLPEYLTELGGNFSVSNRAIYQPFMFCVSACLVNPDSGVVLFSKCILRIRGTFHYNNMIAALIPNARSAGGGWLVLDEVYEETYSGAFNQLYASGSEFSDISSEAATFWARGTMVHVTF